MDWFDIDSAEHQPNKPGTRSYFERLISNLYALRDLLLSHNHDGTDTPVIDVGADVLRNGSFESGTLSGWDTVLYTDGSANASQAGAMDGAWCLAIASSSIAYGGARVTTSAFLPVSGGEYRQFRGMVKASGAGVSSKAKVIWYTEAEAQISETEVYSTASTPTSSRLFLRRLQAPEAARYCKLELTGGVPSVGANAGTVYFDGIAIQSPAPAGTFIVYSTAGTFTPPVIGDVIAFAQGGQPDEVTEGVSGAAMLTLTATDSIVVGTANNNSSVGALICPPSGNAMGTTVVPMAPSIVLNSEAGYVALYY